MYQTILTALLSLAAFAPLAAFAGDGGYIVYSCVSASGRTTLNVFNDGDSSSNKPTTVALTIDGQQVTYASEDNQSKNLIWEEEVLTAFEGNQTALQLVYVGKKSGADFIIKAGFKDPRAGTNFQHYGDNTRDITVNCKVYVQGP